MPEHVTEKRHNYLWGLSPGNIITVFVILTSIVGAEAVDHFRIATLEERADKTETKQNREHEIISKISTDVAVIKAAVKRIERRRRRDNRR